MLRVGLTGGIGSGKSTAARHFATLGALVVDADEIARQVVEPGTAGMAALVERFGPEILDGDQLDRAALAQRAFASDTERRALEQITHPLIAARAEEMMATAPPGTIVVHDVPLLVEQDMAAAYHLVVVVDAADETRMRRLCDRRGLSESDARARMSHQASRVQRLAIADVVLDNEGSPSALTEQIDDLWQNRLVPYEENLVHERRVRRCQAPVLVPSREKWRSDAVHLLRRLRWALDRHGCGDSICGLDHIGSTSVPGLAAKDVIDLQIRVRDLGVADSPAFVAGLLEAGYLCSPENTADDPHPWAPDPQQWAKRFYGGMDPARVVNVHVRLHNSASSRAALLFRDWLRRHPGECAAYEAAKREAAQLVSQEAVDATDYQQAKAPWINEALLRARVWAEQVGWRGPQELPPPMS